MPATRRVTLVDPGFSLIDTSPVVYTTPDDALTDLGALTARVARHQDGPGVLALTGAAADVAAYPAAAPRRTDKPTPDHPVLVSLRRAGWTVPDRLHATLALRHDELPDLRLINLAWLDSHSGALVNGLNPSDTVDALAHWHNTVGVPWGGTPGMVGIDLMREMMDGRNQPMWLLSDHKTLIGEWRNAERPYVDRGPLAWHGRPWNGPTIALDARKAHLAAFIGGAFARQPLTRSGPSTRFDAGRAGFWLADIGEWRNSELPDPAGISRGKGPRWVTTPTLQLLAELHAAGQHPGFTIKEAWTAPAVNRLLRPWAERLRDVIYTEHITDSLADLTGHMHTAAKFTYAEAWGMLCRAEGPAGARAWRPDWHATVAAIMRCNLWRKMAAASRSGRHVLSIDYDEVVYADDHDGALPDGFKEGDRLGQFKVTRRAAQEAAA